MRIKGTYEIVQVDDSHIAVPLESDTFYTNQVITLNETGEEIFRAYMEDTTEEAVLSALVKKYSDSSPEEIAAYLHEFTAQLKNEGLLA